MRCATPANVSWSMAMTALRATTAASVRRIRRVRPAPVVVVTPYSVPIPEIHVPKKSVIRPRVVRSKTPPMAVHAPHPINAFKGLVAKAVRAWTVPRSPVRTRATRVPKKSVIRPTVVRFKAPIMAAPARHRINAYRMPRARADRAWTAPRSPARTRATRVRLTSASEPAVVR